MKDDGLMYTQVTMGMVKLLRKIRTQLENIEKAKKRKKQRVTKREICNELIKRCKIKRII